MTIRKLTTLELRIMDALWSQGALSVREVQETFPESERPAYTTIQTTMYRLEAKHAIRRARKISNAHIFEAVISRAAAHRRIIDEFLSVFGGRTQPDQAVVDRPHQRRSLVQEDAIDGIERADDLVGAAEAQRAEEYGREELALPVDPDV